MDVDLFAVLHNKVIKVLEGTATCQHILVGNDEIVSLFVLINQVKFADQVPGGEHLEDLLPPVLGDPHQRDGAGQQQVALRGRGI